MNVLVINCGSSSLKYQLINSDTEDVLAKGLCERIGIDGRLVYQKAGLIKKSQSVQCLHIKKLSSLYWMPLQTKNRSYQEPERSKCNRTSCRTWWRKFLSSVVITDEMIKAVKECNDLAPLHNPANLIGIDVRSELMPGVPQVGVFDTAFHQTMPAEAYLYGLPIEYTMKNTK